MTKILCILQRPCDRLGFLEAFVSQNGYTLERCYPCEGQSLPTSVVPYQAVIILGGSMSVNDEHLPAIRAQLDWIPNILTSNIPILGICLGGQLLARALGATVKPHPKHHVDIGYVPIEGTSEGAQLFTKPFYTYHWNKEGFELPQGATLLATGQTFSNQAFCYDNAYGIQFHPEINLEMIHQWTTRSKHMLSHPGAHTIQEQLTRHERYATATRTWFSQFLEYNLQLQPLEQSA